MWQRWRLAASRFDGSYSLTRWKPTPLFWLNKNSFFIYFSTLFNFQKKKFKNKNPTSSQFRANLLQLELKEIAAGWRIVLHGVEHVRRAHTWMWPGPLAWRFAASFGLKEKKRGRPRMLSVVSRNTKETFGICFGDKQKIKIKLNWHLFVVGYIPVMRHFAVSCHFLKIDAFNWEILLTVYWTPTSININLI